MKQDLPDCPPAPGAPSPADILLWRKARRSELLALRRGVSGAARAAATARITGQLAQLLPVLQWMTIGLYWPIRGEFDPRFAARALRARGARTALPEVVQRAAPLRFRLWWPGVPMHLGEYGIPTPRDTPAVVPQALLIPALGFDAGGYRLGYGSGYYDRTLAALRPQPLKIGIAFECCRMPTIHPQAHDIPLDLVVTEAGMRCAQAGGPDTVADPGEVLERLAELVAQRNGGAAEGSNASGAPQADAGDARRFSSPVCYLEELERERERQKQR